jgi:hypothetical protein
MVNNNNKGIVNKDMDSKINICNRDRISQYNKIKIWDYKKHKMK